MNGTLKKYIYVNYIVQIFSTAVNFAYSIIIARQLGAFGYGEYSVFYNSLVFALLLLGFNLPSVIIFFITNKSIDAGKLLFSTLIFVIFNTACLIFLLYISDSLGLSIHIFPGGKSKLLWIFFFAAQFLLLQINQILSAFLNAHKIFISISIFSLAGNVLLLIFWLLIVSGAIYIPSSKFNLIWWVSILVNTCVLIYSAFLIYKKIPISLFWQFLNNTELKTISVFAFIVYLCNTIQFLNYKMDIWFINFFKTKAETGVYSLALSLSQLIWVLPNAISSVLLNYLKINQRIQSIKTAINYAGISIYLSFVTAILLSIAYYFALPYIYGEHFYTTFKLCIILFLGTVPFSLSIIIANLNSSIGFVKINLYATILTFLLGFVLDLVLIPHYGMYGAAIAKVIIYITGLIFQIIIGNFLYKLPWMDIFKFPNWKNIFKSDSV